MQKELKIYLKSLLWILIPLIIFLLITNILYYFDIISNNLVKYFKLISILIPSFMGGFIRGKESNSKGYLSGLKLSFIFILIIFVLSILMHDFSFFDIIYYLILTLTITFGSMIGINKKKN